MTTDTMTNQPQGMKVILRETGIVLERIQQALALSSLMTQSAILAVSGCLLFGLALGSYQGSLLQVFLAAIKVPLLLFGTALICFPAFYAMQLLLAKSAMTLKQAAALQLVCLAAVGVVWGSLAPPLVFLIKTCEDYRFAQELAIVIGAAGGFLGLKRLHQGYRQLCGLEARRLPRLLLYAYLLVFGTVGAQMSWILRPFIGSPSMELTLFRPYQGSFFHHFLAILGGGA